MKEEYISMQSLEKISKFDKQVNITINDKEYYCDDEILKLIMRNQDKIELLEYNINKAIEYIEKSTIQIGVYGELDSLKKEPIYALKNDFKINYVLSILRGEE